MREGKGKREEKQQAAEVKPTLSSPFFKWLDNFWYHHKWKVIIITFFVVVLVVGIVQIANKQEADVNVTVATHMIYDRNTVNELESALTALMPTDRNGDGNKSVLLKTYKIYSEAEMDAANSAETDAEGNPVIYADAQYNKEQIGEFNSYIGMGECSVIIVSEYLYNDLVSRRVDDGLLIPLSEIYGDNVPEGAMDDGYGVRLNKTGAYAHFDVFKNLPDDTVICLMRPFFFGKGMDQSRNQFNEEYFKNIVAYGKE